MKWKISTIILAAILVLTACGGSEAAAGEDEPGGFERVSSQITIAGTFRIYRDKETGIEYIIVETGHGVGITPRYKNSGGGIKAKVTSD